MPDELQFDRAEYAGGAAAPTCAHCSRSTAPEYYEFGGKIYCSACRHGFEQSVTAMQSSGSLMTACLYGAGAAVGGAVLFYAVRAITGYEVGLIAVAVGWMVGKAVRKGSAAAPGRKYQVMAVVLTYLSITLASAPTLMKYAVNAGTSMSWLSVLGISLAMPFLNARNGPIGLVIIGIGLWEAWKFSRGMQLQFKGPFPVTGASH